MSTEVIHLITTALEIGLIVVILTSILFLIRYVLGGYLLLSRQLAYLEITPPAFFDKSLDATESLFTAIYRLGEQTTIDKLLNRKHIFSVETHANKRQGIRFIICCPSDRASVLEKLIESYIPEAKTKFNHESPIRLRRVFELKQNNHFAYPLQGFEELEQNDPLAYITSAMTKLDGDESVIYTDFVKLIAQMSAEMREIMQTPEFKNLTNKKDLFTRGETSLFVQNAQLRSIWCG